MGIRQAANAANKWRSQIGKSSALPMLMASGSVLVTGLVATPVSAEDAPQYGEIVVTATRTPVAAEDAPATVTVITQEDIADELVTDIKDLVRFEPGVTVRRAPARFGAALGSTGRARNEDFTVRGIGGNRVLIQVDGIRSPQGFGFGAQDASRGGYTDVALIKSVEILRGPASALYGSDGLAGAISFTTSDPADILQGAGVGGYVRAQYSSADEEFAETLVVAGQNGILSAMAAYTRRDFQELDNQATIGGRGEERTLPNPQDGTSNALLGKLVWDNGAHRLRLTGEYIQTEVFSEVLTGLGDVFLFSPSPSWTVDSLTADDTTERTRISADWTWEGEGLIDYAHAAAYWQDGEDVQFTDVDRTTLSATPRPDRERRNTFENRVYGFVVDARGEFAIGAATNVLAFGGDVSFTRQQGLRDGVEPSFGEVFPTRAFPVTDFTLGGVFLADELSLFDNRLSIFPALRFDFYELDPTADPLLPEFSAEGQSDNRLSPKLGVTFKATENVRIYGNYVQGFRAPTPSQVNNFFENLAFGYTSLPNADLGPETSESYEIGVRFGDKRASLQLVAFQADYDDFISQQVVSGSFTPTDPAVFQFVNFDQTEIQGLEAKGSLALDNGITGRFAIAYADGDIIAPNGTETPLDTIDPLNLVLGLGYRAPDGRFGGELIVTHNSRKSQDDAEGGDFRPDAFTILDATAFVALTDTLKLRVGIFNITDETFAYWSDVRGLSDTSTITEAFTRPGRNASASLSFKF